MTKYIGDYSEDDTLYFMWSSNDSSGSSIARTTAGTISVYKDNNLTQSTAGVTDTADFDSITGINLCTIVLTDAFYVVGTDYNIVLSGATIDSQSVNAVIASFSIENRHTAAGSTPPTAEEIVNEWETQSQADPTGFHVNVKEVNGTAQTANDNGADINTLISNQGDWATATGFATPTNITAGTIASVTNQVTADVTSISGDSAAADNLEATYDGTGYEDAAAPAQQQQMNNLSIGAAGLSTTATGIVGTPTGTQTGTYVNTQQADGVVHQIADDGGTTEIVYAFDIGGNGVPSTITLLGRSNGGNDDLGVYGYNWTTTSWEQIGIIDGKVQSSNDEITFSLYTTHVGTGANIGKVHIRFYNTGLTSANFYIDQLYTTYSVVVQSVGYANGMVWINSLTGVAGTTSYVNGTADNPVDSLADALTIAGNMGLSDIHVSTGSTIVLAAALSDFSVHGFNYTLTPGGYALNNCTIYGAVITGVIASGTGEVSFWKCLYGDCTLPVSNQLYCGYAGTMTLSEAGTYILNDPFSAVAGNASPIFDCSSAGNQNLNFRHASMGIELRNFGATGTDTASVEGDGQIILASSCTSGGNLTIRGNFTITDNASGVVNITDDARYDVDQIDGTITANSVVTAVAVDVAGLDGDAMRGTDSAATVGAAMTLADNSIKAVTFDESTAYPLTSVDSGATEIARTGADSDTLETLSDEIALQATAAEQAKIPKSDGTSTWNATALASINAEVDTALSTAISSPTAGSIADYVLRIKYAVCNKMTIDETNGNTVIHNDGGGAFSSPAAAFTSLANVTKREKLI